MNKEDILEHNRLVYKKIYESIIIRGLERGLDKRTVDYYVEIHHILPKCMGGSDDESNLVMLTGREHVICHMLLERMYPDNPKLIYAFSEYQLVKLVNIFLLDRWIILEKDFLKQEKILRKHQK